MAKPGGGPYDRISVAYDFMADPAEHRARDRGLELLGAAPGERVIEIGAGTGHALVELAHAVGPGGGVCGLDASAGMLRLARQRVSSYRRDVHLQQGDGRSLPYVAATFDAAFMSFTLELFDPPDAALVLAEIRRVLRPKGRLAVVSLNVEAEPSLMGQVYAWLHRRFPHWIDCRPIDVLRTLERNAYRPMCTESMSLLGLPVMAVTAEPVAAVPSEDAARRVSRQ